MVIEGKLTSEQLQQRSRPGINDDVTTSTLYSKGHVKVERPSRGSKWVIGLYAFS